MKLKILKPIYDNPKHPEELERYILGIFHKEVYQPLFAALQIKVISNSTLSDILQAVELGHIRYIDGKFQGVFSAEVSKELRRLGAVWSKKHLGWAIREDLLPIDVRDSILVQKRKDEALKRKVEEKFSTISSENIVHNIDTTSFFDQIVSTVEKKFKDSVKNVTLAPKMSEQAKKKIAEDYSNNLKLYIRDFLDKEILSLRKQVHEHVFAGERYEDLAKKIRSSYGVSQRKAKFLARQETNLLSAKIKEVRYADVGIDSYLWHAVAGTVEHPTRPRHKELDRMSKEGKEFKFSDPPITTESGQAARRNNPGEDFNCRCAARPVVRF
jgi:SPP1 gp7 family putative phage head morphogenesis protein